jgi:hypothetical protein
VQLSEQLRAEHLLSFNVLAMQLRCLHPLWISVLQALEDAAADAKALQSQLAEARTRAQAVTAETATVQRLLDSELVKWAATAGRERQLEAEQRRLEAA